MFLPRASWPGARNGARGFGAQPAYRRAVVFSRRSSSQARRRAGPPSTGSWPALDGRERGPAMLASRPRPRPCGDLMPGGGSSQPVVPRPGASGTPNLDAGPLRFHCMPVPARRLVPKGPPMVPSARRPRRATRAATGQAHHRLGGHGRPSCSVADSGSCLGRYHTGPAAGRSRARLCAPDRGAAESRYRR
jgi:hypothetical protein